MIECALNLLHDAVPVVVSIAVLYMTWSFNRWQRRLAHEQLRHQIFEHRLRVYNAYRELLLKLTGATTDNILSLYINAWLAGNEVPFLFEGDKKLKIYLDGLLIKVDEILENSSEVESARPNLENMTPTEKEKLEVKRVQLAEAKRQIPKDHLDRLATEFTPFLKLTDFSKASSATKHAPFQSFL